MTSSTMSCCLHLIGLALLINVLFATYLGDDYPPPPPPSNNPSGWAHNGSGTGENPYDRREPHDETPAPVGPPLAKGGVPLGPVCTRLGRRCVSMARCLYHERRCQCSASLPVGDGLLDCTSQGNMVCSVDCDPKVRTWTGDRAPVNLPCWYTVSHFRTPLRPQPQNAIFKWCQVHVKALNTLTEEGLFFVGAVVVSVWVAGLDSNGFYLHGNSHRKFEVNVNRSRLSILSRRDPWKVWEKVAVFWEEPHVKSALGGKVKAFTSWAPADRFAVLRIPHCSVEIKYRPFGDKQPQMLKPGVVVALPKKKGVVEFHGYNYFSVCQSPQSSATFRQAAARYHLQNPAQLILLYVLLQKNLQSNPAKNPQFDQQCVRVRSSLQAESCRAGRLLAIRLCGPLLNLRHHFVKCLGRKLVMKAFEKCVCWACEGHARDKGAACDWLHTTLREKGCAPTPLMAHIGCHQHKRQQYIDKVFSKPYLLHPLKPSDANTESG